MNRLGASILATVVIGLFAAIPATAQSCYTASEMDEPVHRALQTTAEQAFQQAQQGNTAGLQATSEFSLGDVLSANKEIFSGQAALRNAYLLDNTQPAAGAATFLCGIANSRNRVGFDFGNLPAGKYAVVIQTVTGGRGGLVTWILHQSGTQWKIAGLYPKPGQIAGHDGTWYLNQARSYKGRGQMFAAYLYYLQANDMLRPFPSMSTDPLDALSDEMQQSTPANLPTPQKPMSVPSTTGRTFSVTNMFVTPVGDGLDLVVKHAVPDISDSSRTFQDNTALIKAVVTKYPELRDAFAGVVARAVAPNGQDYGTLLAMKDVK